MKNDAGDGSGPVWQFAESNEEAAAAIAAALSLPPLISRLLVNRGALTPGDARHYLEPNLDDLDDPHTLPDMEKAVSRLERALQNKEKIFLHGDYDADGVTSAALCLRALNGLGADVVGYVPKRTEGYDLQIAGVDKAKAAGASLILTADCGSCAIDPIAYANSLGIEVIVTDHHRPGAILPNAVAIVNPYRSDCDVPAFRELCGAGVAFKVLDALVERVMPIHRSAFRKNFVDLVALGTVADVTPLYGENRIFVFQGLRALAEGKKVGLRALMEAMQLTGRTLDTESISFKLGPRLNAAGRAEDADIAYRLLTTKDENEAAQLTALMGELHDRIREETARVTTEAMVDAMSPEQEGRRVLILARPAWGKGVVGIAATRIMEARRRPVIILSHDVKTDQYHGSARTFADFNLHAALHQCSDLLGKFGGHSGAAGVSLPAANLEAFRDRMHAIAADFVSLESEMPTLVIDEEIEKGGELTYGLTEWIQRLAPFGRGNAEPTFVTRGAVVLSARRMGKENNHFAISLRLPGMTREMRGVWFNNGDWADRLRTGDEVDVAYTPKINEWRGAANVELSLKDIRLAA